MLSDKGEQLGASHLKVSNWWLGAQILVYVYGLFSCRFLRYMLNSWNDYKMPSRL